MSRWSFESPEKVARKSMGPILLGLFSQLVLWAVDLAKH